MLDIDICFLVGRILTPNHPKAPENGAFPLFAIHNGEEGVLFGRTYLKNRGPC